MGILARIVGWIWRRWADYQSSVALLDMFDLKTAIAAGVGFCAMMFFGSTNQDWSAPGVVLAALIAAACVAIIMAVLRAIFGPKFSSKFEETSGGESPLKAKADLADQVQIEFRWKPGGANDPFEINAIVTAKQNVKNLALIGHFATDKHYLSHAEWIWEPSIRLLKLDDIFKGEVKTVPVIRCPRTGNAIMIFDERTWALNGDNPTLVLLRVTAVSDSGEQFIQKAYNARQFGAQNDFQPIHLDDLSDIKGAENPVVTRIASATLDRAPQRVKFENDIPNARSDNKIAIPIPSSSALKIETGSGPLFESHEALSNGQVRKTSKIAVTNAFGDHLSNCRVQIKYIAPHPGWHLPQKLHLDTFSLIAGESKYLELASSWDGNKIRVKLPSLGTMDYNPDLPAGRYLATLEATADQIKPVEAYISMAIDDVGQLQIRDAQSTAAPQAIASLPRLISLLEAATRAYEQTRNKTVSGVAEAFENSPDDVLIWYCDAMARPLKGKALVTLWGLRPPSRRVEQIYIEPLNNYEFVVENGGIILKPRKGSGQYENIVTDENQVAAAIEEIAQWGE